VSLQVGRAANPGEGMMLVVKKQHTLALGLQQGFDSWQGNSTVASWRIKRSSSLGDSSL